MASTTTTNGTHQPLDWSEFYNIIDGKLEKTAKSRHSINPATGKPSVEVPVSTQEDVNRAMEAAKKAFKPWAATPYAKRKEAVLAFGAAIAAEKEKFADMLTQEQGKPVSIFVDIMRVPFLTYQDHFRKRRIGCGCWSPWSIHRY